MSLIKKEAPTQKSECHRRKAANTDYNWLILNYEGYNSSFFPIEKDFWAWC